MSRDIEKKCVFALSADEMGVPLVAIGIPEAAWNDIKDGKATSEFNLTKAGLPLKIVMFGAATHDEAIKHLQDAAAQQGITVMDERNKDFSL